MEFDNNKDLQKAALKYVEAELKVIKIVEAKDKMESLLSLAIIAYIIKSKSKDDDGISFIQYLKRPYIHILDDNMGFIEAVYVNKSDLKLSFRFDSIDGRFFIEPNLPMLQYVVSELQIPMQEFDDAVQNLISKF